VAKNFAVVSEHLFARRFTVATLSEIFSRDLVLDSEDSFFDFVKREIDRRDNDAVDLLSYVDLLCISSDRMEKFLEVVEAKGLTGGIWASICNRLKSCAAHPLLRSSVHQIGRRLQPGTDPFDGVFALLTRMTGSNCAVSGGIGVRALKTHSGNLNTLFEGNQVGRGSFWVHSNVKDGWLEIDFLGRRLAITHYTLRSEGLRTWTIEGSNDGSNWTVIDSRTNDETFHGHGPIDARFECHDDSVYGFRLIRLCQKGLHWSGQTYTFLLARIEMFGWLVDTPVQST
jgi:hypothetical protein